MSTPVFSAKLDSLPETLELAHVHDRGGLIEALARGASRPALAVGSGGSAISAEYLARCRETLGMGPTSVQTPMELVLRQGDLRGTDVWLFSAGGDNSDAVAAARAAIDRKARALHLVTRTTHGAASGHVERSGGTVHLVPVSDRKDGFLATHSLLATMVATLIACDALSHDALGAEHLLDRLAGRLADMRDAATRASRLSLVAHLGPDDTVIIASDPLLRTTSVLIDTSVWEAALCHVQTTDFRNLAHGRHVWLHHRADRTLVVALSGGGSRSVWAAIDRVLPPSSSRVILDHGACGRLDNALAAIDGLGIVEAIGTAVGIDPGRPGIGDFGRLIYEDRSLADQADDLPPHVRHKRDAMSRSDQPEAVGPSLRSLGAARLDALAGAEIGGIVLDYDGTVVTTADRYKGPDQAVVDELVRLHRIGLRIGFATGRGGSAGEELRKVLPADMPARILVGYYNGGHLRSADVDIDHDPAVADPAITETAAWLASRPDLFVDKRYKHREVQITIDMDVLRHPYRFAADLRECAPFAENRVRVAGSGHSYDIVPARSSKLAVVEALRSELPAGSEVLRLGDSGARSGNDHALLSHPLGISVGDVCDAADGCWSMFGTHPVGPEALLKVLQALIASASGSIRFDVAALGLDR